MKNKYKPPRNEFHFYLQRVNKFSITKNKKKEIYRKRKHKVREDPDFFMYFLLKRSAKLID